MSKTQPAILREGMKQDTTRGADGHEGGIENKPDAEGFCVCFRAMENKNGDGRGDDDDEMDEEEAVGGVG